MEHSGICQKIVAVERDAKELKEGQRWFTRWLLVTLFGVAMTLLGTVFNLVMNDRTLKAAEAVLKLTTKGATP